MRINVLGPIELTVADRTVPLTGQRQRALLAALTLEAGKAVAVDRLVDFVWDTNPPPTARARIQAHVSALRQAIGQSAGETAGPLLTRPPELFASALALWRGSAVADIESPLIRSAADKLAERRLLGLEAKADADLVLGRCGGVAAELSPSLGAHPFRERMRAMLMLALYRLGCRADALALYRDGQQLMVAELGLEPGPQLRGPQLRGLHQRILADDPALLPPGRQMAWAGSGLVPPPATEPGPTRAATRLAPAALAGASAAGASAAGRLAR
jgi:DNA-binding SARP family transcriptional activator